MEINKVAVIGAGIMGHGIAQVVSSAGIEVSLNDIKTEFLEGAHTKIDGSLEKLESKGKIDKQTRMDILSRIHCTTEFSEAVRDTDLVVEAAFENLETKKEIFRKLNGLTGSKTILTTNTSQFSITEIASVVDDASRVIGMHFFNPPVLMKLVNCGADLDSEEGFVDRKGLFRSWERRALSVAIPGLIRPAFWFPQHLNATDYLKKVSLPWRI